MLSDISCDYDSTPTEQRNFRRFNRSDDNKTKEKEVIIADDLDADLESYLAQRNTKQIQNHFICFSNSFCPSEGLLPQIIIFFCSLILI